MPKYGKEANFSSGFDNQNRSSPGNYRGFVKNDAENANMSFSNSSQTNSVGEEDYIGDSDGSMDKSANNRGAINGVSDSN